MGPFPDKLCALADDFRPLVSPSPLAAILSLRDNTVSSLIGMYLLITTWGALWVKEKFADDDAVERWKHAKICIPWRFSIIFYFWHEIRRRSLYLRKNKVARLMVHTVTRDFKNCALSCRNCVLESALMQYVTPRVTLVADCLQNFLSCCQQSSMIGYFCRIVKGLWRKTL